MVLQRTDGGVFREIQISWRVLRDNVLASGNKVPVGRISEFGHLDMGLGHVMGNGGSEVDGKFLCADLASMSEELPALEIISTKNCNLIYMWPIIGSKHHYL